MEIEVRYRHEDEAESVFAYRAEGESLRAIGQAAAKTFSEDGVCHAAGDQGVYREHTWQAVYDGGRVFVEVVAYEGDE